MVTDTADGGYITSNTVDPPNTAALGTGEISSGMGGGGDCRTDTIVSHRFNYQ